MHLDLMDLRELTVLQLPLWSKFVGEVDHEKVAEASTLEKVQEFIKQNDTEDFKSDRGDIPEYLDVEDPIQRSLYQAWDIAKDIMYKIVYPQHVEVQRADAAQSA